MSVAAAPSLLTNLFYLGGSRLVVVCMNLVTTTYMARALGIQSFGILNFSLSYVAGFIIIVGLGYDALATRDVAHDPSRTGRIVEAMLAVRGVLALLGTAAMLLGLLLLGRSALTNAALAVQAITLFSVAIGLSSVFQGLQEMRIVALREFLTSLLNLLATLALVHAPGDVVAAAAIGCVTQTLMNLLILHRYARRFGFPRFRLPRRDDLRLARESLTFFWLGLMIAITYNLHFLLIGLLRSEEEVGYFAAAWKLFNFAIILPNVIAALFLPRIAQLRDLPEPRVATMLAAMRVILLCTVPVTMLGQGVTQQIVTVLFGADYLRAAPALGPLLVNALVVGLNIGLGTPLMATGRQGALLRAVAIGAGAGVVANVVLVPWQGIGGAAAATLISELVTLTVLVLDGPDMPLRPLLGFGLRCLAAVVPALLLTRWLAVGPLLGGPPLLVLALAGGAGGLAYLVLLRALGISVLRVASDLRHLR